MLLSFYYYYYYYYYYYCLLLGQSFSFFIACVSLLLPVNDCDRLTGALTVCVNESLHSALYRKCICHA